MTDLIVEVSKKRRREPATFQFTGRLALEPLRNAITTYMIIFQQIFIADRNDNSPVFEDKSYVFSVTENSQPGVVLGSVRARDEDKGKNGEIEYRLRTPIKKFTIEASSGEFFVAFCRPHLPSWQMCGRGPRFESRCLLSFHEN